MIKTERKCGCFPDWKLPYLCLTVESAQEMKYLLQEGKTDENVQAKQQSNGAGGTAEVKDKKSSEKNEARQRWKFHMVQPIISHGSESRLVLVIRL